MTEPEPLRVDTRDPTPPYEQLRRQLAALITGGALEPGRRLPPLRQLAADLGLAVGTVARTYRELETEGLVVSRRGGGTRVSPGRPVTDDLTRLAQAYLRDAARLGATAEDALRAVTDAHRTNHPYAEP